MNIELIKEQLSGILASNLDIQEKVTQSTQMLDNAGLPQHMITKAQEIIANQGGIGQVMQLLQNGGFGEMAGEVATDMAIGHITESFMGQISDFFGVNTEEN